MLYQNIIEAIGRTPTVKINKINSNPHVGIYLKLEGQNPGGSIKDRIAAAMIEAAEKNGSLNKNKIIIEATSGNTGIGLAMVAAYKGYSVVLTMPESVSDERRKMLKALGASFILTDGAKGTDGAILKAREIYNKNPEKYWMPNQFANPANPEIHYRTTAEEILKDVPGITHFVAGLGTSGTVTGISRRFREARPEVKIIAVEPVLNHRLQGLKNMEEAIIPAIFDPRAFDQKIRVTDESAKTAVRELAKKEGIFLGMSSGAALHVALKLAKKLRRGNIVIVAPDRGEKYISTDLFD